MTTKDEIKKRGAKPKYFTEEEKKEANRENFRRYYERNKEEMRRKQVEKYAKTKDKLKEQKKEASEIYKLYKDGKLIPINSN